MYRPLPKELRLGFSKIHDIGLFAKENIPKATNFGMSHIQISETIVRTPLGGFINHSDNPNCAKYEYEDGRYFIEVIKPIGPMEELTLKYTFYSV